MNCVVSLIQILLAAVLHISTVKTASLNKEVGKSKNEGQYRITKVMGRTQNGKMVPFLDVYNKSMCQTREMLVDIYHEYPEEIEHTYIPSCVVLKRCSGCCNDEALECVPSETRNVTMEVLRVRQKHSQHTIQLSFTEHLKCDCRQKPEVKAKKEKGKGQKRKRKKQRDTIRIAEAEAYTSTACRGSDVMLKDVTNQDETRAGGEWDDGMKEFFSWHSTLRKHSLQGVKMATQERSSKREQSGHRDPAVGKYIYVLIHSICVYVYMCVYTYIYSIYSVYIYTIYTHIF